MKYLSGYQVSYIKNHIQVHGITPSALLDELTDHICSMVEKAGFTNDEDFYLVHKKIMKEFKTENFLLIRDLTNRIINNKNNKEMKSIKFITACLTGYATFIMLLSLFLDNTGGNALRMSAFIVFAGVILLLSYFLIRYKKGTATLKITEGLLGYFIAFALVSFGLREINFEAGSSLLHSVPYLLIGLLISGIILFTGQRIKSQANVKA